jgi:hypothetical protein
MKKDEALLTNLSPKAEAWGLPLHSGLGFTLHTRLRPWKHILSFQSLGCYTRRVRSRAPLEKSNTKASRGPSDDLAKSPAKNKPNRQSLEEYPYSSIVPGTTVRYHN